MKKLEWLLHLANLGMTDFIILKLEKTFGESGDVWDERWVCLLGLH